MDGLLPGYKKCFFCGPATGGLGLELRYGDGKAACEFTASDKFQGYDGILHGGIVSGILDEVMWWTVFTQTRQMCATSRIEVEFKRPVECGKVCARGNASFREFMFTLEELAMHLDFRGVSDEIRALFQPQGLT